MIEVVRKNFSLYKLFLIGATYIFFGVLFVVSEYFVFYRPWGMPCAGGLCSTMTVDHYWEAYAHKRSVARIMTWPIHLAITLHDPPVDIPFKLPSRH